MPSLALVVESRRVRSLAAVAVLVVVPSAAFAQKCALGSYSASGNVPCTLASPGYYVKTVGAKVQTPAAAGYYVPTAGASSQTAATPGHFVATSAATSQTLAPAGYYVAGTAATAPTPAGPGYYVPSVGATAPTAAAPGYYVAGIAATAPTPAAPGQYVPGSAATSPTIAPAGTYVPTSAASAPTPAAPGEYSPQPGLTAPLKAGLGFYVPTPGATAQIAAAAGYFAPIVGSASQTPCAASTESYGQAPACRFAGGPGTPWVPGSVGPTFDASFLNAAVFDLGHIHTGDVFSLDAWIRNTSTSMSALGVSNVAAVHHLTDLTLRDVVFAPTTQFSFSVTGLPGGTVLSEGAVRSFSISGTALQKGAFDQLITFRTDESAGFGGDGNAYSIRVVGTVAPEPATVTFVALGLAGLGAVARRRRRTA